MTWCLMRRPLRHHVAVAFALSFVGIGCTDPKIDTSWHQESGYRWRALQVPRKGHAGFEMLTSSSTGLTHVNTIDIEHGLANRGLLDGAGVALGDVDGDGLPDVVLASEEKPAALYHNDGAFHFTDVTKSSGLDFAGRSVVLTGVGREGQVGEAVAAAFAERGARVFLVDRQETEARARADALVAAGRRAAGLGADLTDESAVAALVERVRDATGGRVHALVHLAGGFTSSGPVAESDATLWARQFAINATSACPVAGAHAINPARMSMRSARRRTSSTLATSLWMSTRVGASAMAGVTGISHPMRGKTTAKPTGLGKPS